MKWNGVQYVPHNVKFEVMPKIFKVDAICVSYQIF